MATDGAAATNSLHLPDAVEKKVLAFAENVKNQQNDEATEGIEIGFGVGNGCGSDKGFMGFAENDEAAEFGFGVGNGCGNEKGFMGFAENVKNQEIDEAAEVIEIGNECENEKGFMGFAENQERKGKKVRKGKGQNKCARTDGIEKRVIIHVEESTSENGYERKSDGTKIFYARKEMEALRFVNVEDQKKNWVEMYCGFGPVVTTLPLPDAVEKKVLAFAENVKNQQNDEATEGIEIGFGVGNGCGSDKGFMGFTENVKNRENDEATEFGFGVGNGCGNEKGFMGFAENVKNQEIDEAAEVIEIGFGVGNECGNEKGFMGFAENQERKGKKVRKGKRKGKGQNKCARTDGIEKRVIIHVEESTSENGYERKSDGTKIFYSRKEMEALRFVNVEDQKKKWVEMYCGFGPVVTKEYDGLVDSNRQQKKQTGVNFDPRKNIKKSFVAPEILGEERFETLGNEINMNPSDTASGVIATDLDGCTAVEEECIEDDDSDAEYNSIQRPVFLVTGAPDFDAGPAQDGLEYLRRVRWETERVQKVTFAKIEESKLNKQTIYMPKIPDIARCPEQLMPLKEWESAFLTDFSELRLALSQYEGCTAEFSSKLQLLSNILEEDCSPQILESNIAEDLDNSTTYRVDSGQSSIDCPIQITAMDENEASPSVSSPKTVTKVDVSNRPTLSTILDMDSVARVSMLKKRIKLAETMTSLSKNDCAWLFALCAAVDSPLNADTCAALRDLLRKCASLRAEKSELDDEVVMINILATISGKYFGQSEN